MSRTERQAILEDIVEKVNEIAEQLATQAVDALAETGQTSSFKVSVNLIPGEEGISVRVGGALRAGTEITKMKFSTELEQLRLTK